MTQETTQTPAETPDTPSPLAAFAADESRFGLTDAEKAEIEDIAADETSNKTLDQLRDDTAAAAKAERDGPDPAIAEAAAKAKADEDAAAAAAQAEADAEKARQQQQAQRAALPQPVEVPAKPKDFEAEAAAINELYNTGKLELTEREDKLRAIYKEEDRWEREVEYANRHNAQVQATVQQHQAAADADFATVASQWMKDNADFCGNPLRKQAMQQAIHSVDDGSRTPAQIMADAQKIAFEAYGWKPTINKQVDALAGRQPKTGDVPQTLAKVPAVGHDGPSSYSDLDVGDVRDMERAVAGMNDEQVAKFLSEVDPD